jgi:hypothetical protein
MKATMRPIFLILALALLPGPALPAADKAAVAAALAQPADAARYPQAGAVVLLDETVLTLDAKGRTTLEGHLLLKILQDRALREMSDQKISFRGDTHACEILTALTHLPDGSTRAPEASGLMEVSDPEAAAAPFYSNARLKVVSFPAVQIGAVLELKYRVTPLADAKAGGEPEPFMGELAFGGEEPVLAKSLTLKVPAGTGLKYELFNGATAPAIVTAGASEQYAWSVRDLPQLLPEAGMVPAEELVPRVVWTVAKDREDLGRWLARRFQAAARPDAAVTAKAKALTAALAGPEAKVERLALFVTKEIQNVPLGLGRVGYLPTAAPTILANRYADPRDKYVLFQSLLDALGDPALTAQPVFVHQDRVQLSGLACLSEYQGILARVTVGGAVRFYDLEQNLARLGELMPADAGRPALLAAVSGGQAITTPAVDQRTQFIRARWDMALDAQGNLKGRITMSYGGLFDRQVRSLLFGHNEDERRVLFQESASQIKQGTRMEGFHVSDLLDLTQAPVVTMDISIPELACRQGDMMILDLPRELSLLGASPVQPQLPAMKHPFLVPTTFAVAGEFSLDLPAGYRIAYQPPAADLQQGPFDFQIASAARTGGLLLKRSITWREAVVQPAAYPGLWRAWGRTTVPGNGLILLEKQP